MYKQGLILLIAFFTIFIYSIKVVDAVDCQPLIQTIDEVGDIVYYRNDTISYSECIGTLIVANPSTASSLSAVNITSPNGSIQFINGIEPQSSYTQHYTIEESDIFIPLKLKETIVPSTLYSGIQQEIRLCVEIENNGSENITGFSYRKSLPPGLSKAWIANDAGEVYVNDSVTWTLNNLAPGEKINLIIAFNVAPTANINFTAASINFTYLALLAGGEPAFSGCTDTSFKITKSQESEGTWRIDAIVSGKSEFKISLNSVKIYRSPVYDPFNTIEIASYTPNVVLSTGDEWKTQLVDYYDLTPSYFIKVIYTMPYTLNRQSIFTATTEPFTITVSGPTPTATPGYSRPPYSYIEPWKPTITPIPTDYSGIVFIRPTMGEVVRENETLIKTSVPPANNQGYVVYFGSTDNSTWVKIGESSIIGNTSEINWIVPYINSKYYLKAEHYDTRGLIGIAYTYVIIAHETQPVGLITMLISGTDWLMLLLAFIALMLLAFILRPYFMRKPVIYDSSALYLLSKDSDWLSKLPRNVIRPDEFIHEIPGVDRIKMKSIRGIDEMKRLKENYGLKVYDAMALQLAKEKSATLYTADSKIVEIGKMLGIDVKLQGKKEVAIKREA